MAIGFLPAGAPAPVAVAQGPVVQQPAAAALAYLSAVDQLLIHQKIELAEIVLGFETNNQYIVKNSLGQQVFVAKEKNDCCTRQCCGPSR